MKELRVKMFQTSMSIRQKGRSRAESVKQDFWPGLPTGIPCFFFPTEGMGGDRARFPFVYFNVIASLSCG